MSTLLQDLRLSARQLLQRPVFTLAAVLTLAIGIGLNTVAFTVVNGILFKGSAVSAKDDVGRILTTPGGDDSGYASLAEYERFSAATRGALDIAAEGRLAVAWRHQGTTQTAWVLFVSANYFSMVNTRPIAGQLRVTRGLDGVPSIVIGERFWRRHLAAMPITGLTLRLNEVTVGVSGVLPETYTGPAGLYSPDIWLPLAELALFNTSPSLHQIDERWLFVLGRLQRGATVAELQSRVETAAAAMARDWPDTHARRGARFRMIGDGNSELRQLSMVAAIIMSMIGLVLLLACFNVANLLLARAVEREREMALRAAIGATSWRLVRFVVTEGLLFATLAGTGALVLSRWTQTLIGSFAIPIEQPQHIDLSPDLRVVAFTVALVVIAGVLPGLWPALAAVRVDLVRALGASTGNSSTASTSRVRAGLVWAQIAGSTAFLALAGLMVQSYEHVSGVDLGFDRDRLVVAQFEPASHGYDAERAERFTRALSGRIRALPGVSRVTVADRVPFFIGFNRLTATSGGTIVCESETCPKYATMAVDQEYFQTLGIAFVAGRAFRSGETAAVIINQPLARRHWPDGGGVGDVLRLGDRGRPVTVVGITAKAHTRGFDREEPTLYLPIGRDQFEGPVSLVAHTTVAPESLVRAITEAADAVDPNVALVSVKTMAARAEVQLWPFRTISWLFSICGSLALVLATVGLGGAVIHNVNRRRKEFGVRVSVGAAPRDLVCEVLRGSVRLLVPGLIAGTLVAFGVAQLLRFALFGVNVLNPLTYAGVALLECAIVGVACFSPALRASRVDPLVALRSD